MRTNRILLLASVIVAACSGKPGSDAVISSQKPDIFPDYQDVTIPRNIAPMNFMIDNEADAYYTTLSNGNETAIVKGRKVCISDKKWQRLTQGTGSDIDIRIFTRNNGQWTALDPFTISFSDDLIDRYISYRRIPLVGQYYHVLDMVQRDLTSFDERTYLSNTMIQEEDKGSCINCHHYSHYRTDNMQLHVRQYKGGTILIVDGQMRKINLKTDSTVSAGVYPAWHPTHGFIAYSNNKTFQSVHAMSHDKIEVLDEENDIVLYDIENNTVSPIENDSAEMECFPAWSADGRTLYYVSNHYDDPFDQQRGARLFTNDRYLHFNLYEKPFDPDSRTWGPHRLVYDAAATDSSMTWPRVSPDGRYLMACISTHGIFPLDQIASDLFLFDFENGTARHIDEINSPYAESYHSWASGSKWVMFSTRREDGVFTRLYFSHIDGNGHFSKPFALPQKDPENNRKNLFAFNVAEFMIEPIGISPEEFADFIDDNAAIPAVYEPKRETDAPETDD